MEPYEDQTCPYLKYVFVSDRQKGLKLALDKEFNDNLSTSCAFHIRENVKTYHSGAVGKYVVPLAKTFSVKE